MANADLCRAWVSTAFESAIDSAATEDFSGLGEIELNPNHPDTVNDEINGTIYEQRVDRLDLSAGGTLKVPCTSQWLARLVKYVMSAKPTSAGVGPYTHTWTDAGSGSPVAGGINESAGQTITATIQASNISTYIKRFTGVLVPTLTLSQGATGRVELSAPLSGSGTVATTTAPAGTIDTEGYFAASKTTVSFAGSAVSKRVSSMTLFIDSGLEYVPRMGSTTGSKTAIDRDGKRPFIDFTMETDEGAVTEGIDDWTTPAVRAIILSLYGDSNRSAVITLKNARLMDGYPIRVPSSHGVYKVTRKYRALYDSATTPKWFSIVVTNSTSAYA